MESKCKKKFRLPLSTQDTNLSVYHLQKFHTCILWGIKFKTYVRQPTIDSTNHCDRYCLSLWFRKIIIGKRKKKEKYILRVLINKCP